MVKVNQTIFENNWIKLSPKKLKELRDLRNEIVELESK